MGVVGTLALHAVLVLPLLLDLSMPAPKLPNSSGAGASATVSSAEPVMTVVFINEPATLQRNAPSKPLALASRGLAPIDLPIVVLSPDPLPAADATNQDKEEESSVPPEAAGDQAQHALLYGRYLGQVQARIERAWLRPRMEIGAAKFSCRTRIEQNPRGDVVGIKLDQCNGNERWQQSLVSAIRTASPLPAPPDPSVYADRLWLTFQSEGFRPGSPAEEFEPVRRDSLVAGDRYETGEWRDRIAHQFGRRSASKDDSDVIYLTIVGSPGGKNSNVATPASTSAVEAAPNADPATQSPK